MNIDFSNAKKYSLDGKSLTIEQIYEIKISKISSISLVSSSIYSIGLYATVNPKLC